MLRSIFVFSLITAISISAYAQGEQPVTVQAATKGSTIKLDGRIFGGFFASDKQGSYPDRSFDIPDAKLRFTYSPSQYVSVISRLNIPRASSLGLDYLYVEVKDLHGLLKRHSARVGKIKMDLGQETWTDNPVESNVITNSAPVVSGYDEGVHFFGPILDAEKFNYSLALVNGTKDVGNSGRGMATVGKLSTNPVSQLYAAATFYSGGELKRDTLVLESDLRIGGLQKAASGAKSWKRSLWEIDVRWNYGSKGVLSVTGSAPKVPYQLAAAYGQFTDDFIGAPDSLSLKDRTGSYWYVEGLWNATKKFYVAARLSDIKLDDDVKKEKLAGSPVAVNEYQRLSVGAGYRLSDNVIAKIEGTQNDAKGATTDPEINQLAVGLSIKF